MSKYTPEQKQEALRLLADESKSYAEIRDICRIPVGTLAGWAKGAGIERPGAQKLTAAATAAHEARIEERRRRLKDKLLKAADVFIDRAVGQAKGSGAREAQALMTAAGIAFDKFRLEMGEVTQRTEQVTSPASKVAERLDQLAERRAKSA